MPTKNLTTCEHIKLEVLTEAYICECDEMIFCPACWDEHREECEPMGDQHKEYKP